MIDHLVGTPSPSWKRTQVFLVIFFWLWRITWGDARGPRVLWMRALNRKLDDFTPWQIIVSTLTAVYAMRNADKLVGLGAPEPLARLYSPSYYRATWINTGLDAGFATAMNIRQKWLRDICSIIFSVYYIIFANEADEKLRKFRAAPTVEMLRVTWEKTSNPFLQLISHKKPVALHRKILLPRPNSSPYTRPITAYLFYSPRPELQSSKDPLIALSSEHNLIFDVPGGGFISMGPEHHEERLRSWAVQTGKPVISIEYGKAPEYPYPFAVDEIFDAYRIIVESKGKAIGMAGKDINVILSGDSAGGCLATGCVVKIIEHNLLTSDPSLPYHAPESRPPTPLLLPVAVLLSYPAMDFNFTSWMTPSHLKVLREETEADEHRQHSKSPTLLRRQTSSFFYTSDDDGNSEGWAKELRGAKDHLSHANPLAMVNEEPRSISPVRKKSWRDAFGMGMTSITRPSTSSSTMKQLKSRRSYTQLHPLTLERTSSSLGFTDSSSEEEEDDEEEYEHKENRPIEARIQWHHSPASSAVTSPLDNAPNPFNTLGPKGSRSRELLNTVAQARLAEEVRKANMEVAKKRKRAAFDRKNAPIGMRLTMTSRSGYFQDRIISPTMMRAMAILYIGPHLNPDFASDYHISPILTPSHLLANFPPLLLQCGEKDPLVDDTIIFAGRVREAKRQRREELRKMLAGGRGDMDPSEFQRLEDELDSLEAESDDDWLQMQIFSGWSHGYLQMPSLMPEAQVAIDDLASWIEGVFSTVSPADSRVPSNLSSPQTSTSEVEPSSPFFSHIFPWAFRGGAKGIASDDTAPRVRIVTADAHDTPSLGYPLEADFEDCVTIVPKVRRESAIGGGLNEENETFRREKIRKGVAAYNGTFESDRSTSDSTLHTTADEKETSKPVRSPPRAPKSFDAIARAGTPGKGSVVAVGGQIISESELMRRRRLLDSHIFVSESIF
ncbi:Alpha/Beta hydrolase protein [Multifurca ochricompacta]|uniref:Alpha/Beta hydrolase protein n=1 Tax=Multifurca ochricompacta TaxID=376703 RepID=A0AAD4M8I5_9AGAM|nr:Alpha/Beta hydrolase protein [Multifurca ochricompacta]